MPQKLLLLFLIMVFATLLLDIRKSYRLRRQHNAVAARGAVLRAVLLITVLILFLFFTLIR